MEYLCYYQTEEETQQWNSQLEVLEADEGTHFYELEIKGRGSLFHVIIGDYSWGTYICIPNHDVGSALGALSDIFWNRERLSRLINPIDAATVAYGLNELSKM